MEDLRWLSTSLVRGVATGEGNQCKEQDGVIFTRSSGGGVVGGWPAAIQDDQPRARVGTLGFGYQGVRGQ